MVSPEALGVNFKINHITIQLAVDFEESVFTRVGDKLHAVSVKTALDPALDVFDFKGTSSPLDLICCQLLNTKHCQDPMTYHSQQEPP